MKNNHLVPALCLLVSACTGNKPEAFRPEPVWKEDPQYATGKRGDLVAPTAGYLPLCMDTEDGLKEAVRWWDTDKSEVVRLVLRTGGEVVEPGDTMKVLDPGILKTKVRVTSSGRECFVIPELARPKR